MYWYYSEGDRPQDIPSNVHVFSLLGGLLFSLVLLSNKLHKLLKYVLDMEFQAADNGNAYESILYACMSVLLKLMPGLTLLKTMFKGRRGNSGV